MQSEELQVVVSWWRLSIIRVRLAGNCTCSWWRMTMMGLLAVLGVLLCVVCCMFCRARARHEKEREGKLFLTVPHDLPEMTQLSANGANEDVKMA